MKTRLLLGMAGAVALTACGDTTTDTSAADDTATLAAAEPTAESAAMPDTATPQGFVDTAASSDMYEVEAGKLAEQMGTSEAVKGFGAMMAKDHTGSTAKLKAAVGEAGGSLSVPTAMLPKHRQQLDALRAAGAGFDALYSQQQVAAHEEALALMRGEAANGTLAPLKAHAGALVPIIEGHLEQARELN